MNNKITILLRKAIMSDAEEIYKIMQKTLTALEDKSLFVCDDLDYVKKHIEEEGFTVVACTQTACIAGSLTVRFPGDSEDNLGYDIGLSKEERAMVVHMDSAVVLPEFRGNHLQGEMLKFAEEHIDTGRYRFLLTTIAPHNIPSQSTFLRAGYREVLVKEKYGGLMRSILLKKLG